MNRILALIMAGGSSDSLGALTEFRADAALHFGGKFRLIDFSLSNLTNSGIYNIGILTQYMPRSLNDHIGVGKPWDLDRANSGVRLLQPYMGGAYGGWQKGNADAVRRNLDFIRNQAVDDLLILAGDHIYLMDYRPLLARHRERGASVTVATRVVSPHEAFRFGMAGVDEEQRLVAFEEKPRRSPRSLASMGIYACRAEALADVLARNEDLNDFGRDVIPYLLAAKAEIHTYEFPGYWSDAGTVQSYWEANMALIADEPALNLHNRQWVVRTRSEERAPVKIGSQAEISNNLLSNGCLIEGAVSRSVLSPGVVVEAGARIANSVVLRNVHVAAGAQIDRCIIDDNAVIEADAQLGCGENGVSNQEMPNVLNTGLTLIGRDARVPTGMQVGRNVHIHAYAQPADFVPAPVPHGAVVGRNPRRP